MQNQIIKPNVIIGFKRRDNVTKKHGRQLADIQQHALAMHIFGCTYKLAGNIKFRRPL